MTGPEVLTIDVRDVLVRAADALHDAATVGGAPNTYQSVEREIRTLVRVMDELAAQGEAKRERDTQTGSDET